MLLVEHLSDQPSEGWGHAKVQEVLAAHFPPEPLLSPEVMGELDALIEDARAHPERFGPKRYGLGEDTSR